MQDTYTLWVCQDCMLHHANGECGNCHTDEGHEREPWSRLDDDEDTECVTMGLIAWEHPNYCSGKNYGDECGCDYDPFSWESCHGCGASSGGERHAFTGWIKD